MTTETVLEELGKAIEEAEDLDTLRKRQAEGNDVPADDSRDIAEDFKKKLDILNTEINALLNLSKPLKNQSPLVFMDDKNKKSVQSMIEALSLMVHTNEEK